jgi:hypothetical protein
MPGEKRQFSGCRSGLVANLQLIDGRFFLPQNRNLLPTKVGFVSVNVVGKYVKYGYGNIFPNSNQKWALHHHLFQLKLPIF